MSSHIFTFGLKGWNYGFPSVIRRFSLKTSNAYVTSHNFSPSSASQLPLTPIQYEAMTVKKKNNPSHCTPSTLPRILPVKTSIACVSIFTTAIASDVKLYITTIIPTTQNPLFNQFGILDDGVNRKRLRSQLLALFSIKSLAKVIK